MKKIAPVIIELFTLALMCLAFLAAMALVARADAGAPDHRGEEATRSATYRGVRASAPIPPEMHVQNEGGSDGAGLCVIASTLANGLYQGVPGLDRSDADGHRGHGSEYWMAAKARPGGYGPGKLASLVKQVLPDEKYASYLGADLSVLDSLSRKGLPIAATMNTGALYNYARIRHVVSLAHYRTNGWACVVDNNAPGKYSWMPAEEFARRWFDGGIGWAWVWTRTPPAFRSAPPALLLWLLVAFGAVVVIRRQQPSEAAS